MSERIKSEAILYVIPSLGTGGAELQTINQLNYFNSHYPELSPSLVIFGKDISNLPVLKLTKKNIYHFNIVEKPYICLATLKKTFALTKNLVKVIKANKYAAVVSILPISNFICRLTALYLLVLNFTKINLISYYRGLDYDAFPLNGFSKYIFNKFNSLLAFFFDKKTVFISRAVYKNIKENIYIRNPLIIPNSLPAGTVAKDNALEYVKKNNIRIQDKYLILIPGRLHQDKGHIFFIEAFTEFLANRKLNKKFFLVIIAGEGDCRKPIENKLRELDLDKIFYLTGQLDNELLLSFIKLVDLVVIPSLVEGFGNVAIECLQQESLMLTSDSGGLDDIVENGYNGYKFKAGNHNSLLNKLDFIINNKNENIIAPGNLSRDFCAQYTLDIQMEKIMAHILDDKNPRSTNRPTR